MVVSLRVCTLSEDGVHGDDTKTKVLCSVGLATPGSCLFHSDLNLFCSTEHSTFCILRIYIYGTKTAHLVAYR